MPILCIECPKEATIRAAVIGGPAIHFCADHAVRFAPTARGRRSVHGQSRDAGASS